jgi:DNA gyrase/topoisomerase IV subunit A
MSEVTNSNLFEQATRSKVRYATTKGHIGLEDVWDLPLTSLDTIAIALNKQLKESSEESFIKKPTAANKTLQLAFDVVFYIIQVKQKEAEEKKVAADKAKKKAQILELINSKETEQLQSQPLEELRKQLADLD